MKFFLGRIGISLNKNDLEMYFSKFGKIIYLRFFPDGKYAFIEFEEPFDVNALLSMKEHTILNEKVIVEISKENYRSQNRNYFEERGRYGYEMRGIDNNYNDRMNYPYEQGRNMDNCHWKCKYCRRCPWHGSNPIREVPNAYLKMICDGLDSDVKESDLKNFCIENNIKPEFLKISGTAGIIELETINDRDKAFKILDGKYLSIKNEMGEVIKKCQINTKSYIRKEDAHKENENKMKRYRKNNTHENNYYRENNQDVKITNKE